MTTPLTARERVAALDPIPFDAAAMFSAALLNDGITADFVLTPGDATRYRFIIVPPKNEYTFQDHEESAARISVRRHYIVAAGAGDGEGVYPWPGYSVHGDYCAQKWGCSHAHSGEIIARFLNTLAPLLNNRET